MHRPRVPAGIVLGVTLAAVAVVIPPPAVATPPVQVSEGPELSWASRGAAAASGASLYVVYVAPSDLGHGPVRLRRSTDGGLTFLPSVLISDALTTDNQLASVAAAGSSAYVLWVVGSGSAERAWFRSSRDGGATWAPSVSVTSPGMTLGEPGVFASGERVFITYTDRITRRVVLLRSSNRGATFAAPVDIGASTNGGRATMAFSSGVMYLAWAGTEGKIRLRRSTTGGITWNASVAMATPTDGGTSSTNPWLATAGHTAMLVGQSAYKVYAWTSGDDGRHWASPSKVSDAIHPGANHPMLTRSAGRWALAYTACTDDGPTGCEVVPEYLRTSLDGRQWSSSLMLKGLGLVHGAGIARTSSNGLAWVIFDWEYWASPDDAHVYARGR